MILIDASVWAVAANKDHPRSPSALIFLEAVAAGRTTVLTDALALREILVRHRVSGRWEQGQRVYELARKIVPTVAPIEGGVLDRASQLLDAHPALAADTAIHAAVAQEHSVTAICSYDEALDVIDSLERITPETAASVHGL